ncbi:MAG: hypothetical protein WC822_06555 [Candidatus Paceibacterota bacterium]
MTNEKKLRTRFDMLPNGFQVSLESSDGAEHEHWRPEGHATFCTDIPGVIQITGIDSTLEDGKECRLPLSHEQALALSDGLRDLVNYSQKALDMAQSAQFICPDCEHKTNVELDLLPEGHPCLDCGEPGWKNLSRKGMG